MRNEMMKLGGHNRTEKGQEVQITTDKPSSQDASYRCETRYSMSN